MSVLFSATFPQPRTELYMYVCVCGRGTGVCTFSASVNEGRPSWRWFPLGTILIFLEGSARRKVIPCSAETLDALALPLGGRTGAPVLTLHFTCFLHLGCNGPYTANPEQHKVPGRRPNRMPILKVSSELQWGI